MSPARQMLEREYEGLENAVVEEVVCASLYV